MRAAGHDDDAREPLIFAGGRNGDGDDNSDCSEYGAVAYSSARGPRENDGGLSDARSNVQDGVRRIDALSRAWSQWGLAVAYLRFGPLFLVHSLEGRGNGR